MMKLTDLADSVSFFFDFFLELLPELFCELNMNDPLMFGEFTERYEDGRGELSEGADPQSEMTKWFLMTHSSSFSYDSY